MVEALQTYTMALARVWPEDWKGHALQRILVQYRWLSGSGTAKAVQVRLLLSFINHVLTTKASRGRSLKPPMTFKQIEDAMADRIWNKAVDKHLCQTEKDPYASTDVAIQAPQQYVQTQQSVPSGNKNPNHNHNSWGGNNSGKNTGKEGPKPSKQEQCRSFNSPTGCSFTNCRHRHTCNRSLDSKTLCNKSEHGADGHQ